MMPGRAIEPWEELQMDILKIDTRSLSGNKYILLLVDRASKFPFGFLLPSKETVGVARILNELCLTFGVPKNICCDGGGEFGSQVVTHLCRWLRADIRFGPADQPRGQGSVERLGGWLQEMLAELCRSWPDRWDEYVSPAIWMKRVLPDLSLPADMTPFELLFGRAPRTSLDSLVPLARETERPGGLDNFVERRRQNMREVRLALEKRGDGQAAARAKGNASIVQPSAGVKVIQGSLVLVRESASSRYRDARGIKLQHDLYTGPWTVTEVLQTGLSAQVSMRGRKQRSRRVSLGDVRPFHVRPSHLRHSLADEFALYAWGPDFKRPDDSENSIRFDSLVTCRQTTSATGTPTWQFKGKLRDGAISDWLAESLMLEHFTPLQLDCFVALWHLYRPPADHPPPPRRKSGAPLSREAALRLFPIGFVLWKDFGVGMRLQGQVYDYRDRYWRVRYSDNNWEELTRRELENLSK